MQMILDQGKMRKDEIKQVLVLVIERNDQSDGIFYSLGTMLHSLCIIHVVTTM